MLVLRSLSSGVGLLLPGTKKGSAHAALRTQHHRGKPKTSLSLCRAAPEDQTDYRLVAASLNQLISQDYQVITGKELRELVFKKWGRSYDVRLFKRDQRVYLQVMWKFLEQQSFPLTEVEYMQQLDAVAEYLTEWGVADTVRRGIEGAKQRGPGYTGGTSARCISIPLDVDLSGARKGEWD